MNEYNVWHLYPIPFQLSHHHSMVRDEAKEWKSASTPIYALAA
jgi:hypothetical protein